MKIIINNKNNTIIITIQGFAFKFGILRISLNLSIKCNTCKCVFVLQLQLYFIQICFTQVIVYTIQIRIFCNHIQLRNTSTFIVLQPTLTLL